MERRGTFPEEERGDLAFRCYAARPVAAVRMANVEELL